MPIVNVKGVGRIKFPDNMSTEEIQAVLVQQYGTPQEEPAQPTQPTQPTPPVQATQPTQTEAESEELGYGDLDYWTNLDRWKASALDLLPTLGTMAMASPQGLAGTTILTAGKMVAGGTVGDQVRKLYESAESYFTDNDPTRPNQSQLADEETLVNRVVVDALDSVTRGTSEAVLDIGGAKVFDVVANIVKGTPDVVRGAYTNITKEVSPAKERLSNFIKEANLDMDERALLTQMQEGIEKVGGTMLPSQVAPNSQMANTMETVAVNSLSGRRLFEQNFERMGVYLDKEITKVVGRFGKMGREGLGKQIQETLTKARAASNLNFSTRYLELDKMGVDVPISFRGLQLKARNAKAGDVSSSILSKTAREQGKKLTFLTDNRLNSLRDDILKMSPTPSFTQAHSLLKKINRKMDELYEPGKPNDPILRDLVSLKKDIQKAMKDGARKSGNEKLFKQYQQISADYSRAANVLYSDTANTLAKLNKPEEAGAIIARAGAVTDPKMFKQMVAQFKAMNVKGANKDFMGSVKSGFLEKQLGQPFAGIENLSDPFAKIKNFQNMLNDSDLQDTMKVLFSKEEIKNMELLIKKADILARETSGTLALAVGSKQVGAVSGAVDVNRGLMNRVSDIFTLVTPDFLAKQLTQPGVANKLLGRMDAATKLMQRGDYNKALSVLDSPMMNDLLTARAGTKQGGKDLAKMGTAQAVEAVQEEEARQDEARLQRRIAEIRSQR